MSNSVYPSIYTAYPSGADGYLDDLSLGFDSGVSKANSALVSALNALNGDPSNPTLLAKYQAELSQYTLYRNAQSSAIKAMKDTDSAIISNFR
jgi:type III secretion protein F